MGALGWAEFIPALIDSIGEESADVVQEAATQALTELGAPAQAAVIAQWNQLDEGPRISGLSIIEAVGGEPAAEFALNRFDELMALEPEFCLTRRWRIPTSAWCGGWSRNCAASRT
jgi:hypothetical protein